MSLLTHLGQRSRLSHGGRWLSGLLFASLAILAIAVNPEPRWLAWTFMGIALLGLFVLVYWRDRESPDETEDEDLIEVARRAIGTEASRLDAKRNELEKVLMAYGEWMEFPDYEMLSSIDWKNEAHQKFDQRVATLIDEESDRMLKTYSSGEYRQDGKFDGRRALLDLVSFTESIAQIYQPDSDRPLLELNLESLLKAINRASVQIILLLEELPILEVKEMNLRKATDNIRKASKVYQKYEELQPYFKPVRYLWQGSKLLHTSNPLLAAGWIAGSEVLWKGGKKLGKKAMDAYLLSLARQTLGIIAWETAGIYDSTHRYRNPDWIYGLEIAHLLSRFDATQEVLRETFQELGRLPLRSSYDRLFLYRCIAQNVSPKPKYFAQPDTIDLDTRKQLQHQLIEFYERNISANAEARNSETKKWRRELDQRLGLSEE
ncbi:MAG: hypothetical protein AAGA96_05025 [Verrucomicrobiota bacterium]